MKNDEEANDVKFFDIFRGDYSPDDTMWNRFTVWAGFSFRWLDDGFFEYFITKRGVAAIILTFIFLLAAFLWAFYGLMLLYG